MDMGRDGSYIGICLWTGYPIYGVMDCTVLRNPAVIGILFFNGIVGGLLLLPSILLGLLDFHIAINPITALIVGFRHTRDYTIVILRGIL